MKTLSILHRQKEVSLLSELYEQSSSQLVSVTGRRRVGKTFLIRELFKGKIDFELTGSQNGTVQEQLLNFSYSLGKTKNSTERIPPPKNWQLAFFDLQDYLETIDKGRKIVVFIDEIPWLAAGDPLFLRSFSHFWNTFAERRNMMVIICGSATSWIINNIVRDRGGLHNRITSRIHLNPFTLHETQEYLGAKNIRYNNYSVAELYMAIGGIPFYLEGLKTGLSVAQNIDQLCLAKGGSLHNEFQNLYPALFNNGERHMAIVRELAKHPYGLTRKQIIAQTTLANGGTLTTTLDELEFSGFIKGLHHFSKRKKGKIYRLIDQFSLFYLRFIEPAVEQERSSWQSISKTQGYISWTGYAFENIGFTHLQQIKEALGVGGVVTHASAFHAKGDDQHRGIQIDMVIDRMDRVINLCEFKFHSKEISLTEEQGRQLRARADAFRAFTGTRSNVFNTLISTFGASASTHLGGYFQQYISLDDLFVQI